MIDVLRSNKVKECLTWDPGVGGRILRPATTRLSMWNEIVLFQFDVCEHKLVRSDWSMWPVVCNDVASGCNLNNSIICDKYIVLPPMYIFRRLFYLQSRCKYSSASLQEARHSWRTAITIRLFIYDYYPLRVLGKCIRSQDIILLPRKVCINEGH
jgi:hypothetical protein